MESSNSDNANTSEIVKNDKKLINAWVMYDWANSVYSLVIISTVFPMYYSNVSGGADTYFKILSFQVPASSLYSLALSGAFLLIAFISPLLSSIADYTGRKKSFMKFFCYLGGFSCILMSFYTGPAPYFGLSLFFLAAVGFTGSIVFYNAFLPEIATKDMHDKLSAKGFSYGYVGSFLLMLGILVIIINFESFGLPSSLVAQRLAFILTGLWWIGFAQITFAKLPDNPYGRKPEADYIVKGYKELRQVYRRLSDHPTLKRYLLAFFCYTIGVQTIMYMAAFYGTDVLEINELVLIVTILVIQLVAIPGAQVFAWVSGRTSNLDALKYANYVWILVCIIAFLITDEVGFVCLGVIVGFVMGGIQSLSRSTYSKMLPTTLNHASFFSFYDVTEKIATVVGTTSFGLVVWITGDMRNAPLLLILYFVLGILALIWAQKSAKVVN